MIPNHPRRPFLPKAAQPPVASRPAHLELLAKRSWDQAHTDDGGAGAGAVMEMNPPAKRMSNQSPAVARLPTAQPPQAHLQLTPLVVINRTTQVTPDDPANKVSQDAVANSTSSMLPSQEAVEVDKPVVATLPTNSGDQAVQVAAPSATTKQTSAPQSAPKKQSADIKNPWAKCIEQLHPETGEVLRIYPSGSDAAKLMKVSQGGISQCINGLRNSCYGFRWRSYEGPPIDCKNLYIHISSTTTYAIT